MIMVHYRDPDSKNPYPDPHGMRYLDDEYETVLKEIDVLLEGWEEVWAYLEDDDDPSDWVMIFNNVVREVP